MLVPEMRPRYSTASSMLAASKLTVVRAAPRRFFTSRVFGSSTILAVEDRVGGVRRPCRSRQVSGKV